MSIKKGREKMAALARAYLPPGQGTETQEEVKEEKQKAVKLVAGRGRSKRPAPAESSTGRRSGVPLKQMTIKLGPEVRSRLLQESIRRKAEDSENWPIQQIITEAVNAYLGGK